MTWEYALIGLVVGVIIGAVAMRFGNRKLRQQQAMQYELEKNKAELEEYREELVNHFARSAELLDNMAHDYRQLYQHMAKSSSSLLPEMSAEDNPFRNPAVECVSVKCRVISLGTHPDYGSDAIAGSRPGSASQPRASTGKSFTCRGERAGGRYGGTRTKSP